METLKTRQEESKKECNKLYGLHEECCNMTLYDLSKFPPKENYIEPTEYDLGKFRSEI